MQSKIYRSQLCFVIFLMVAFFARGDFHVEAGALASKAAVRGQGSCQFTITPRNQSFPVIGGTGGVTFTTADPQCQWTARSNAPWIRLTSATSGTGGGSLSFTVAPTVNARRGTIVVANQVFVVQQEFNPCPQPEFRSLPPLIPPNGVGAGDRPRFVLGDFNGDGRADPAIATANLSVEVSFSDGSDGSDGAGGYSAPVTAVPGSSTAPAPELVAGDFNRDNKPDLAVSRQDRVLVALNTSTAAGGSFAAPVEVNVGQAISGLLTGDFNRDGNLDIACGAVGGAPPIDQNVVTLLGNGAGGFGAPMVTRIAQRPGDTPRLRPGDFNGDGRLDLASINNQNEIVILRGNGAGGFDLAPAPTRDPITALDRTLMAVGDFNGDLLSDLAILRQEPASSGNPGKRELVIRLADRDGDLFIRNFNRQISNDGWIGGLIAEDLDGNGRAEAIALNRSGVEVLTTDVVGLPAPPVGYFTGPVRFAADPGGRLHLATGDFNRDGRPDVFVAAQSGPNLSALAALVTRADGKFALPRSLALVTDPTALIASSVVGTADFNGDGIQDMVVRSVRPIDSNLLSINLGDGQGGFSAPFPPINFPIPSNATTLSGFDFNRDGRPDIGVLDSGAGLLTIHINDGANRFVEGSRTGLSLGVRLLISGDFNQDGAPDLMISGSGGVKLLAGNGAAGFTETPVNLPIQINNTAFSSGDFNGDGKPDLLAVVSQISPPTLAVLFGDGQGNFAAPVIQNITVPQPLVRTGDFNNDGRTDVAYTSLFPGQGGLSIALSRGAGRFGALDEEFITPNNFMASPETQSLFALDLNSDGALDLIAAQRSASGALLWMGKNDGSFNPAANLPLPVVSPVLIAPGDFNVDGATDLLISGASGVNNATILLNRGTCISPSSRGLAATSAASFNGLRLAVESVASIFGLNLATETRAANTLPLPTALGVTSVQIKDSGGAAYDAPLFFISPGQINFLIPAGTAPGAATITVMNGSSAVASGTALITAISPGIFSADASGQGLAAAIVLRVKADRSQVYEPVVRFDPAQNKFVAVPIDLDNPSEEVFLILFGSGIRKHGGLVNVTAKVGAENFVVPFAGAQGDFAGLDQVNVRLFRALDRGEVDVAVTVENKAANIVRIHIR